MFFDTSEEYILETSDKLMQVEEINIELRMVDGEVVSASAILPVWTSELSNGHIKAKLPFLGIETYAKNDEDLTRVVNEAFVMFCIVAKKYGLGIREELQRRYDISSKRVRQQNCLTPRTDQRYSNP